MVFVSESMDNKENRTFFPLSMQQIQVKKQLTNILSYRGNSMRRCSKNSSAHISIMTTLKSQHTKGKFGTNGDDSDTATDCVSSIGITITRKDRHNLSTYLTFIWVSWINTKDCKRSIMRWHHSMLNGGSAELFRYSNCCCCLLVYIGLTK